MTVLVCMFDHFLSFTLRNRARRLPRAAASRVRVGGVGVGDGGLSAAGWLSFGQSLWLPRQSLLHKLLWRSVARSLALVHSASHGERTLLLPPLLLRQVLLLRLLLVQSPPPADAQES